MITTSYSEPFAECSVNRLSCSGDPSLRPNPARSRPSNAPPGSNAAVILSTSSRWSARLGSVVISSSSNSDRIASTNNIAAESHPSRRSHRNRVTACSCSRTMRSSACPARNPFQRSRRPLSCGSPSRHPPATQAAQSSTLQSLPVLINHWGIRRNQSSLPGRDPAACSRVPLPVQIPTPG